MSSREEEAGPFPARPRAALDETDSETGGERTRGRAITTEAVVWRTDTEELAGRVRERFQGKHEATRRTCGIREQAAQAGSAGPTDLRLLTGLPKALLPLVTCRCARQPGSIHLRPLLRTAGGPLTTRESGWVACRTGGSGVKAVGPQEATGRYYMVREVVRRVYISGCSTHVICGKATYEVVPTVTHLAFGCTKSLESSADGGERAPPPSQRACCAGAREHFGFSCRASQD